MVFNNKMAAYSTIIIMILTIIFHILILTGVVPYEITWGGRLKSYEDMLRFETVSILVNITVILIVAAHMRWYHFILTEE